MISNDKRNISCYLLRKSLKWTTLPTGWNYPYMLYTIMISKHLLCTWGFFLVKANEVSWHQSNWTWYKSKQLKLIIMNLRGSVSSFELLGWPQGKILVNDRVSLSVIMADTALMLYLYYFVNSLELIGSLGANVCLCTATKENRISSELRTNTKWLFT